MNLKNPELLKFACLINGNWQTANSGETFAVKNPFDDSVIGQVPSLSDDEIEQAIQASATAQKGWGALSAFERARILHRWADLIDEHLDDLAVILTTEQGKPVAEACGEIGYANSFIRWFAEEGKRIYGDTLPSHSDTLRYVVLKQPVGVCAAITPWNFPCAMIARKVAPALAAGCTMIVKPSEDTPLSALALGVLAQKAGVPDGVLQIVTGDPKRIGKLLCEDKRIAKLSFTGSTAVGRILMAQSADSLKKLSMELGGNAPFIVFDDADLDKAVEALMVAKFRNAGQVCIGVNRIYLQNGIKERFLAKFSQKVAELKVGNGFDKVNLGVLINDKAVEKAQRLLKDAVEQGASVITGGQILPCSRLAFAPTVVVGVKESMAIAQEEIFAPIATVYDFETEEEVLERANATEYGLAAYFCTQDLSRSWRMSERLEFGMVAQNTGRLSNEIAPFGGVKQSGFGREGSKYGIDEYLTIKYWCVGV